MSRKKKIVQEFRPYCRFLYKQTEQLLDDSYNAIHSMMNQPGFTDKGVELRQAFEDQYVTAHAVLRGLDRRTIAAAFAMQMVLTDFHVACCDLMLAKHDVPPEVRAVARATWELAQGLDDGFFRLFNFTPQPRKKSGEKHE